MNENEIQTRIDALSEVMVAKGLPAPEAHISFKSNREPVAYAQWKDSSETYGSKYHAESGETIEAAFEEMETYIAAIPEAEHRKLHEFMGALGKVIDLGRERGIEVAFVNPLVETMKKLSENIITYQPTAAE